MILCDPSASANVLKSGMTFALVLAALALQAKPFPTQPLSFEAATDIDGLVRTIPDPKAKATVLLFMTVDCPINNRYAPEIARIASEFGKRGVAFYRVYVDTTVGPKAIQAHGKEFKFDFPAIVDADRRFVKPVGASVTPEAAVLDPKGKLLYRGRIDDRYVEHGNPKTREYRQDLRIALREILAGKAVTVPQTPSIGCGIPERSDR